MPPATFTTLSRPDPFLLAADLLDPPAHPYVGDPVGYAEDILHFHPWSKQRQILESVRDNKRTAVRACHGPGKTAIGAEAALWFLGVHRDSRVITTAPTWAQVEQLLWREIRAAITRGERGTYPKPSATKLEMGDEWFAIGLSTNEPERFQGHHADHILLIVDEASGVAEDIYEAAEGFLTADGARMLLLGNPTQAGGQFHRAFTTERAQWSQIHISVYDTPNLTGEAVPAQVARSLPTRDWVDEHIEMWGVDSPIWQVRGLGQFADTGINNVISLAAVEAAQMRELDADAAVDLCVLGCDVARYGNDETVITERVGQRIRIVEHYQGQSLTHTAARLINHASHLPAGATRIVVDDDGVGGGVTDILRAEGWNVTAFKGAERAFRPLDFPNRRSELWFEAGAQLVDLDLDSDEQLAADLTSPRYSYDLKQRRVVEPKDAMKKRLGRSPDRGDAVLLTLVPETSLGAVAPPAKTPATRRRNRHAAGDDGREWTDDEVLTQPM